MTPYDDFASPEEPTRPLAYHALPVDWDLDRLARSTRTTRDLKPTRQESK